MNKVVEVFALQFPSGGGGEDEDGVAGEEDVVDSRCRWCRDAE